MDKKKWIPHDYQCQALSFLLSRQKCALFLDPGLGKTSISLSAIKILKYAKKTKGVLVIAPLRVIHSVWPGEIKKWDNFNSLSYTILHGNNKKSLTGPKKDIYLINPEGLAWLHKTLYHYLKFTDNECPFNMLIIDESTKFKSHETNRFEYIKDMLPLFKRKVILTGTPSPNSLLDLWSQIYILDNGEALYDNYYHYRKKYFEQDDENEYNWILKKYNRREITDKIKPFTLDMSDKTYLDLPRLLFNDIEIELPKKSMALYKKMERDLFITLDNLEVSAEAAAQLTMKCHQIANGNAYEDIPEKLTKEGIKAFKKRRKTVHIHTAKLDALSELVEELNGKPLLIAYHFKHDLKALQGRFSELEHIGSGVSASKCNELENAWNNREIKLLAGHPASMGHGLNLQKGGNDICFYSLIPSLELYIQFYRRVYRQGIKSNQVRVHHLIAKDTIDDAFLMRLGERAKEQLDLRIALRRYKNAC